MAIRVPEIDYYSHHGMWGAYASFILGRIGKGAGFAIGDVRPPTTGLFVGYRVGHTEPRLFPFATGRPAAPGAESFREDLLDNSLTRPVQNLYIREQDIERFVHFSGEEWRSGPVRFRVYSFFGDIPDPTSTTRSEARSSLRPSILIELSFDNNSGNEEMTGVFGMQGIRRPLSDSTHAGLLGMAQGTRWGFAALPAEGVDEVMDWSFIEAAFNGGPDSSPRPLRRLAGEGGLRFKIRAGESKTYILALGVYRDGIVTSGVAAYAYYTCLFKNLEEVLESALEESSIAIGKATALDAELDAAELSDDRKFLVSHAAHSYIANTELLLTEDGEPLFAVNEGEYQMINTLDLTVDHAFWEARFSPWTIRNELDFFAQRYAYHDSYGIAFTHDQGVADGFTPIGSSAYEMPRRSDCFSYMSFEETLNWALTACISASLAGGAPWAASRRSLLAACLQSIRARDANGDGLMDRDSDRCSGGAEITTYDSIDISLGQARNNLYVAVKSWAAFVCMAELFKSIDGGESEESAVAAEAAGQAAASVSSRMLEEGFIPAVFEGDNRSKIIPAIEGLVYPLLCGAQAAVEPDGPYGHLISALKRHIDTVLAPGDCIDSTSGGWRLSSSDKNTWISKIILNQYAAERALGLSDDRTRRDAIHARWLRTGCADFAATDQIDSATGRPLGSKYYPRLVTAILWLWPLQARS